jgi:hypothetical protein
MASTTHGFNPAGDSGVHTTELPPSSRLPFLESRDSGEEPRSLDLSTLAPGTTITVATRNSTYQLVLRNAESQAVTVTGGRWGDEPVEGHVAGSSINGVFLSERRIEVGLSLDLEVEGRRVVTSRVQSLTLS